MISTTIRCFSTQSEIPVDPGTAYDPCACDLPSRLKLRVQDAAGCADEVAEWPPKGPKISNFGNSKLIDPRCHFFLSGCLMTPLGPDWYHNTSRGTSRFAQTENTRTRERRPLGPREEKKKGRAGAGGPGASAPCVHVHRTKDRFNFKLQRPCRAAAIWFERTGPSAYPTA